MKEAQVEGEICLKENCYHCCIETEMILSKTDVSRINKETGLSSSEYTVLDSENRYVLKNKEEKGKEICYFLSEHGRCTIYAIRPEGCRYYPIIWNFYNHQAFSDDYCPHHDKFEKLIPKISPSLETFILKIFGEL